MTALHWAAYNRDKDVCEKLLSQKEINIAFSKANQTPVDIAGVLGFTDIVKVFIKHEEMLIESREEFSQFLEEDVNAEGRRKICRSKIEEHCANECA